MPTLLGHTLGTPASTPFEALDLFAASGLDGAELIWQDDYTGAIPESDGGRVALAVKAHADELGLSIGCLTPYVTRLNDLDEDVRLREIGRLERAIAVAHSVDCPRMRVYGGTLLGDEPEQDVPRAWSRLVDSLRRLGAMAADHGVVLCVENHFGTMTVSAADTVALVEEVGSEGVGILYDQANLAFTHREEHAEAIRLQAGWIMHVHVKDLEFIHPDRVLKTTRVASIDKSERIHASRMIGDGILDWPAIVRTLIASGYDGSYSLEYEYRWNPDDLPDPEVGFPESARRLRACFEPAASDAGAAGSASEAGARRSG
jgi:sugar phosphate isomerase/epimerase